MTIYRAIYLPEDESFHAYVELGPEQRHQPADCRYSALRTGFGNSAQQLRKDRGHGTGAAFPKRRSLHFEGDPVRDVAVLTADIVKIAQYDQSGDAVILRLNGRGQMIRATGFSMPNHLCIATLDQL